MPFHDMEYIFEIEKKRNNFAWTSGADCSQNISRMCDFKAWTLVIYAHLPR